MYILEEGNDQFSKWCVIDINLLTKALFYESLQVKGKRSFLASIHREISYKLGPVYYK